MVFKFSVIIFVLMLNLSYANIIYDKNNITITEIELDLYKKLFEQNNGYSLKNNQALKKLVLLNNTINFLLVNNNEFMILLDERIKSEYGKEVLNKKVLLNFIRFQKIRSEFITEYFQNNFNLEDLELIFSLLSELSLPLSLNNCLTIEKLYDAKNDKNFISSFFTSLKGNKNKFKTEINGISYDICINEKLYNDLESYIIKYIEKETEEDFNKFIYGKIN